ncbi:iron uptake porin [Argonema antarcticum]|uniref:iron uptake porin n=1 Tax=Argonema antarcticum TaxID=2942763 RepID=UPI0020116E0B|nr:iron uptake porin [Argonema antarcticum]MCL1475831.1 iron uptake porin [Argonema antarcticum A004/B2]
MSKTLWNALKLSPALLGATILVANSALAAEESARSIGQDKTPAATELPASGLSQNQPSPISSNTTELAQVPASGNGSSSNAQPESNSTLDRINQYNDRSSGLEQVTSVSQLRDVQPTDWAFQALQSLVERYGCIEGYPDRTYRGNRALTRYEFAAGLNSCLNRIQELIAAAGGGGVTTEDIERLRRLQEEFRAELTTLRGRVDALEARTARLEAQQFSTTTKLKGEVIFALASVFGDDNNGRADNGDLQDNPIFGNRARLNFDTSFTGKDLLRTRVQARNITQFDGGSSSRPNVTGTSMTRLGFDGDNGNDVELDDLYYRFPLSKNARVTLVANSGEFNDLLNNVHPIFESSGGGAISRFGRYNPIYRLADGGAGATVNLNLGSSIGLDFGYLALNASNPTDKNGLFDGAYAAMAQVVLFPKSNFNLGLTYAHYYSPGKDVNLTGSTGSSFAQRPFGSGIATSADALGAEFNWRPNRRFILSGWFGYTMAEAESGLDQGSNADVINYAVSLGLPDIGRKGNFLGLVAGVPPKVTSNDLDGGILDDGRQLADREDNDTSYHLEAFYRIKVSDNISITPGAFVILNPEHNDNNDTIYVGTVRTTFSF